MNFGMTQTFSPKQGLKDGRQTGYLMVADNSGQPRYGTLGNMWSVENELREFPCTQEQQVAQTGLLSL